MSVEAVREYLRGYGMQGRIQEFDVSSATVTLAAEAVGVPPQQIAKTLSLKAQDGCLLLVAAGDAKIDNAKFKAQFCVKAKMLAPQEVLDLTGHPVGGVCPFALKASAPVYLDVSMRRFDFVFPAAGSASSAVRLTPEELFACARAVAWVDVCKGWGAQA